MTQDTSMYQAFGRLYQTWGASGRNNGQVVPHHTIYCPAEIERKLGQDRGRASAGAGARIFMHSPALSVARAGATAGAPSAPGAGFCRTASLSPRTP